MEDDEFLQWIYDRLVHVHGESPNFDYMHKLRAMISELGELEVAISNLGDLDRFLKG